MRQGPHEIPQDRDPRRRRTREALRSAFILLAMERRYHEIRIEDILQASEVGRSTFYEHFSGKDALLAASMDDALALLAEMATGQARTRQVADLLAHFWQNRALAPSLFQGTALRVVRNALVSRVEARIVRAGRKLRLPHRLAAHAVADGLLSPILAWLSGAAWCSAADLADALHASSRAMLDGMAEAAD